MLLLNNYMILPSYKRKNNLCFMLQDTNELIGIPKNSNIALFENVILDGVQNFVLISTILLLVRIIPNVNSPKAIIKLTDPLINFSKKIINFQENYYFQVGLSSALLTYISTIAGAAAIEQKKNQAKIVINKYIPFIKSSNHFVAK